MRIEKAIVVLHDPRMPSTHDPTSRGIIGAPDAAGIPQLASDTGITQRTAKAWLSVLEASYLVMLLRPHHANFRKRLVRSPKLCF